MWNNHSISLFVFNLSQGCRYSGFLNHFKNTYEACSNWQQNIGHVKQHKNLVPHFSIILLHDLTISLLNIYHAKFPARICSISLWEKRKYMSLCCAKTYGLKSWRYASINSSSAHPPPGNRGAFAHLVSPGDGAFAVLSRPRGLGISIPRGDPRAFNKRQAKRQATKTSYKDFNLVLLGFSLVPIMIYVPLI